MESQLLKNDCIKADICEEKSSLVSPIDTTIHSESDCQNYRTCKSCNQHKPISDYPKKGAGRYEDKCKPCHNEFIKARRQKRKTQEHPAWSIKSIPCKVEFSFREGNTFPDVLYQLFKSEGYANIPNEITNIESLINDIVNK